MLCMCMVYIKLGTICCRLNIHPKMSHGYTGIHEWLDCMLAVHLLIHTCLLFCRKLNAYIPRLLFYRHGLCNPSPNHSVKKHKHSQHCIAINHKWNVFAQVCTWHKPLQALILALHAKPRYWLICQAMLLAPGLTATKRTCQDCGKLNCQTKAMPRTNMATSKHMGATKCKTEVQ